MNATFRFSSDLQIRSFKMFNEFRTRRERKSAFSACSKIFRPIHLVCCYFLFLFEIFCIHPLLLQNFTILYFNKFVKSSFIILLYRLFLPEISSIILTKKVAIIILPQLSNLHSVSGLI